MSRMATSPPPTRRHWHREVGDHRLASDDEDEPRTGSGSRTATRHPPSAVPAAAAAPAARRYGALFVALLGLLVCCHFTGLLTFTFANGQCTVGSSAPEL